MPVTASSAEDRLAELYRSERAALLRLAALLTGDRTQAEDVVHDAFAGLQRRWPAIQEPDRAAGYLRVSVVNGARSLHRRRAVARRHLPAGTDPAPAADAALLLSEQHRATVAAVRRLPRRQQQVIILRYWADLTDPQIADALRISPVTVRATASRALSTLRALGKLDPMETA